MMVHSESLVIYRAENVDEADYVINFLKMHNIWSSTREWCWSDPSATSEPVILPPQYIDVVCGNPDDAARAIKLIGDKLRLPEERRADGVRSATIDVLCGGCGTKNVFESALFQTVQVCQECKEFLDVE